MKATILASLLAVGCAASNDHGANVTPPSNGSTGGGDASRAILEADIIQMANGRLYALSKSGSLSIVDVSQPGKLALLGQAQLPGEPFEMYRRGDVLIAMANGAVGAGGEFTNATDPNANAIVLSYDISDPAHIREGARRQVLGEIADSRIVGNVMYLATYENSGCYGCTAKSRTLVTSFDITQPFSATQVDQAIFESNAPEAYSAAWGMHWKRSIVATDQRLYIGGHADIDPSSYSTTALEGIIDVLDITDPKGHLGHGARIQVAGAILSRWQMDERNGVLRVISQRGIGRTGNGIGMPAIETFAIRSTSWFDRIASADMTLPRQEGLRSVRFDGARAYAITYNQTDPLFVIDLTDASHPQQRGELFMPGFMYYLEPHGDRVIGLGIDRGDSDGSLNVSLFDVSDADHPTMKARVAFAQPLISEDYAILDTEVAEDQDRIQKAFRTFDDGLVVVPFTQLQPYYATTGSCANAGGGVQLVRWADDTLSKRALLPLPGNPRRAIENGGELLGVSDSNVRAYSLDDTSVAHMLADLAIDTCTPDTNGYSPGNQGGGNGDYAGDDTYDGAACNAGGGSCGALVAIALLALRRRRQ